MAQWLYTLVDHEDITRLYTIFQKKTCENSYLEMVQWLTIIHVEQLDIDGVEE